MCFFVSDKAPTEAVFRGTEFLSYDLSQTGGEPIVSAQDSVTFYFKTRAPSGLLFYTGEYSFQNLVTIPTQSINLLNNYPCGLSKHFGFIIL